MIRNITLLILMTSLSPIFGWRILPETFSFDPWEQQKAIERRNQENMRDILRNINRLPRKRGENGQPQPDGEFVDERAQGFDAIVGGVPADVIDLVESIKHPEQNKSKGIRSTRGVLLVGPAGTGKTLIARAVSEEIKCPFIEIAGSDFVEVYVGTGAQRVRELFDAARSAARLSMYGVSIIFIDEIDALGKRSEDQRGGDMEYNQTINALLKEMSSPQNNAVIVMAATNHVRSIDRALLRPGRFDKIIQIPLPDVEKREAILKYYARGLYVAKEVDWKKLAEHTDGLSPADLKELINMARTFADRDKTEIIAVDHMLKAARHVLTTHHGSEDRDVRQQIDALNHAFGQNGSSNFIGLAGEIEPKALQLVDYLRNPDKYTRLGIKFPKGALLVGPPGTGKTSLAREIARAAGCAIVTCSASEFINVYVGSGAQSVRTIFEKARKKAESNAHKKAILFIDDIDIMASRSQDPTGGESEGNRTIGELLNQMDGFYEDNSVTVIAATNHREALDPALDRRFNFVIEVPLPHDDKRLAILEYYTQDRPLADDIDLKRMSGAMTSGFSAAKLKDFVDEAAMQAALKDATVIDRDCFEEAWDITLMGERTKLKRTDRERKTTAYHEAGHAMVSLLLPETSAPLYKLTIVSRARALGLTFSMDDEEKLDYSVQDIEAIIMRCLGGRLAEEIFFDLLSAGASNDFQKATGLARSMVAELGMSDLGPITYDPTNKDFLYSGDTAKAIDDEVKKIIDKLYIRTKDLLTKNKSKLKKLGEALYEKETLYADEVYSLLGIAEPAPRQ